MADNLKQILKNQYDKVWKENNIYIVKLNDKYGVLDKNGNQLIEPKYDAMGDEFCEGMLPVWGEGGIGYIDENGNESIPCKYHSAMDFQNGLVGVCQEDKKWGFINKHGEVVISPMYDVILGGFSEKGVAEVKLNNETFFIDKQGKKLVITEMAKSKSLIKVLRSIYDYVSNEGKIYIVRRLWKYGIVDKKGNLITNTIYDEVDVEFSEGLMAVRSNEGYGYIDRNGKEVIHCQYSDCKEFKWHGLAGVCNKSGKWGFINKSGEEVIPFLYDRIYYINVSEICIAYVEQNGKGWYIDKNGNRLTRISISGQLYSYIAVYEDGKISYLPKVALYLNSIDDIKVSVAGKRIIIKDLCNAPEKNIEFPAVSEMIGVHRTTWNDEQDVFSCFLHIDGDFEPMKLQLYKGKFAFKNKAGSYSDTVPLLQEVYYDGIKLKLEKNEIVYYHGEHISLPYTHKEINGGNTSCKLIWGTGEEIIKKCFPLLHEQNV